METTELIIKSLNDEIQNLKNQVKTLREENELSTQPKTGKWIDRSEGGRILHPWMESYKCDQCGDYGSGAWNYCPNCGADMRGKQRKAEEDDKSCWNCKHKLKGFTADPCYECYRRLTDDGWEKEG